MWNNDFVKIVDKKSIKKSNINFGSEAALKLFKFHSKNKFTIDYVKGRYFRTNFMHSSFGIFKLILKNE